MLAHILCTFLIGLSSLLIFRYSLYIMDVYLLYICCQFFSQLIYYILNLSLMLLARQKFRFLYGHSCRPFPLLFLSFVPYLKKTFCTPQILELLSYDIFCSFIFLYGRLISMSLLCIIKIANYPNILYWKNNPFLTELVVPHLSNVKSL